MPIHRFSFLADYFAQPFADLENDWSGELADFEKEPSGDFENDPSGESLTREHGSDDVCGTSKISRAHFPEKNLLKLEMRPPPI